MATCIDVHTDDLIPRPPCRFRHPSALILSCQGSQPYESKRPQGQVWAPGQIWIPCRYGPQRGRCGHSAPIGLPAAGARAHWLGPNWSSRQHSGRCSCRHCSPVGTPTRGSVSNARRHGRAHTIRRHARARRPSDLAIWNRWIVLNDNDHHVASLRHYG